MSEAKIKKSPKKLDEKKRWLLAILIPTFVVLASIAALFTFSVLKESNRRGPHISTFTVNMINEDTSLEGDKSLALTNRNTVLDKEEVLRFSSTNLNVGVGPYLTKPYIFEARGGTDSNVTMAFSINGVTINTISFEIYVSDIDGSNITKLGESALTVKMGKSITYLSNSDIFINKVVVNYTVI